MAGQDPNWGRIVMAIGKSNVLINLEKLSIKFGELSIISNGKLNSSYNEMDVAEYMKNSNIEISINISKGSKSFTTYTMDLTKKYIEINSDYRS